MKYYELISVIPARYTETEVSEIENRIKKLLETNGAEVLRTLNFGKIKMAYTIGDNRYGIFSFMVFKAEPTVTKVIKSAIALFTDIMRFDINTTNEKALARNYNVVAYEEPMLDIDRGEQSSGRPVRRTYEPASVIVSKPVELVAAKPMSSEEIEAQIDKILEEKII